MLSVNSVRTDEVLLYLQINIATEYTHRMSFSREKKFFSYLWNFLKFLFTCVKLMITVVSYVIRFCSWLTVAASKEKTYLYKKFTTSVGEFI